MHSGSRFFSFEDFLYTGLVPSTFLFFFESKKPLLATITFKQSLLLVYAELGLVG